MPQSSFGTGFLFATPAGANPTPVRFGALQDVTVDFSFDLKMLYGASQFALEQARGKAKIELKASIGRLDPALFNQVYFGLSAPTGEVLNSVDEAATPSSGAFTVANGSTYATDLGLYNTVTGLWMTRVAASPAAGQYTVNTATGVYATNTAQNGQALRASYTYASASTGSTTAATNQLMGSGPIFGVSLVNRFRGKSLYLNFPAVQSSKLGLPLKLDDFTLSALDMSAQDDGNGNVFTWSMTG